MTPEQDGELIRSTVSKLSEHWECVEVLVSRLKPNGGTESRYLGSGNYYARKEMCRDFVEIDKDDALAKAISREIKSE